MFTIILNTYILIPIIIFGAGVQMSNLDKVAEDFLHLMGYMRTHYLRPAEQITRLRFSPGHFHALAHILRRGSFSMSELAAEMMISKQQLTPIVDRLVEAGVVVRQPDENDRRLVRIEVTEQGRSVYREIGIRIKDNFKERLSAIPERQLNELEQLLPRIMEILNEYAGSPPGGCCKHCSK